MKTLEEIRFYRATGEHGYLSNLYPCEIQMGGRAFATSEHAYQFGKPSEPAVAEWLMAAPSPSLCAQAAHALFPWQVKPDWNKAKVQRMKVVLIAKFTQHPELRARLLATGGARLIEESKMDNFWGMGKSGNGQNMLGVLLMELRDVLRQVGERES